MTTVIRHGSFCAIAVFLSACSENIPTLTDTTTVPSLLVVSKVVSSAASPSSGTSLVDAVGDGLAYVSLPSGTAPSGNTAQVRNRADGATASAFMFSGGFDPTPIAGSVGDTLEVTIRTVTGEVVLSAISAIPAGRKPTVIRTSPPPRKRDVPLNSTITVVFSDPMKPETVNGSTIRVARGADVVAGQLLLDESGTQAEFIPQSPLDPNTLYTVSLTEGLADVSAETLIAATFDFTTTASDVSQVAFSACVATGDGGQACGIHVVSATGDGFAARSASPGNLEWDGSPSWSPDGRRIAFASWRHCAAQGKTPPSAGGDCRRAVYVMNADGSEVAKLTTFETDDRIADFPAWSPNGAHIVFTTSRVGTSLLYTIHRMNPDGTGLEELVSSTQLSFGRPAWSPDGTRMVFGLYEARGGPYVGLHVADSNATVIQRITEQYDGFPSWSPDGTRIAFQRDHKPEGWHHIHVIQPDGQNEVQLTGGAGAPAFFNLTPTWSPDSRRIAFIHNTTPRQLRVMNADGSDLRLLTTVTWLFVNLPAWSPFGSVP